MLIQFVMVGLGGALGSMLRYLISLIPVNNTFPFLTLITNLLGALLIGFIVGLSDNLFISKKFLLFLKTGVCGGFTGRGRALKNAFRPPAARRKGFKGEIWKESKKGRAFAKRRGCWRTI